MTLVDANLLLYAKISNFPQHPQAHGWLDEQLNGTARVGFAWSSLLAFLRIATNPRVFASPMDPMAAWAQVAEWLTLQNVWTPVPTQRHADILGELIHATRPTANILPDAHLAALAIEHGLTLCSSDGDFARFPGLSWRNPLQRQH